MNVTKITLLDFGTDELGELFGKLEFEPLIGESKDVTIIALRKGESLTTDIPIIETAASATKTVRSTTNDKPDR